MNMANMYLVDLKYLSDGNVPLCIGIFPVLTKNKVLTRCAQIDFSCHFVLIVCFSERHSKNPTHLLSVIFAGKGLSVHFAPENPWLAKMSLRNLFTTKLTQLVYAGT